VQPIYSVVNGIEELLALIEKFAPIQVFSYGPTSEDKMDSERVKEHQ